MPHWLSLLIFYAATTFVALAFIRGAAILRKEEEQCTTKQSEDKQLKTEHSPTGPTPTTSHNNFDHCPGCQAVYQSNVNRWLQPDD